MIITLDGPSCSGKSTLAQLLAKKLGFFYVNSGYLYRGLAYILVTDFGYNDEKLLDPNLDDIAFILDEKIFIYQYYNRPQIFFKGCEITHYLKTNTVSHAASVIAVHQKVRESIVLLQRNFGFLHNLVTDGRDGGTEIYPQAEFKFYVTALPQVRAKRLQLYFEKNNIEMSFEEALAMTISRDERDMTRLISPLRKADDAVEIDTSYQSIDEILKNLVSLVQK